MKSIKINSHFLTTNIVFTLLLMQSNVFAAAIDAFVSTPIDTPITINLANNITEPNGIVFGSITTTTPSNGVVVVPTPGAKIIEYTPNSGFTDNVDVFSYEAFDTGGASLGVATITVRVGFAPLGTPASQAETEISTILDVSCLTPADNGFNDLCVAYFNATEGERAALANQLAPREIDGQTQISTASATQQIDTIRKRLAALRQGMQGINPVQISYQYKNQRPISIADLFRDNDRGGAASALASPAKRIGIFASGNLGGGSYQPGANSNEDGYDYDSRGLTVGTDYRVNAQAVVGIAFGVINSQMSIAANGGDLEARGFSGISYGSLYINSKSYVEFIAAAYMNTFTSKRNVNLSTLVTATAESETDNGVISLSLGSGYELMSQRGMTLNISGNLDYIKSGIDGYQETGAAGANLTIAKRKESKLTSVVNLQFTYAISQRSGVLIPQFDLAWKHELSDDANTIEGAFASDPVNTRFKFDTQAPESDYLNASLGVQYLIPGGNTGFAHYQRSVARGDFIDYNISVGMRGEF